MKKKNILINSLIVVLVFGFLIGWALPVAAQASMRLNIDQIRPFETADYPNLVVDVTIVDEFGYLLPNVTEFKITEDGVPLPPVNYQVNPIREHPLDIVLVIDTSLNMGHGVIPTPMQNTVAAVSELVNKLSPNDNLALVRFGGQAEIVQEFTQDKNLILIGLQSLEPIDNSPLNDAMEIGIQMLEGKTRPVMILVTNGRDSLDPQSKKLDGILDAARRNSVVIYPVGFSDAKQDQLQKMADLTHGKLKFLGIPNPDSATFLSAFNDIYLSLAENRLQYSLSLQALSPRDGLDHQLTIEAMHVGLQASNTVSFKAPAPPGVEINFPGLSDGMEIGGIGKFQPVFNTVYPIQKLEVLMDGQPLGSPVVQEPFEFNYDLSQTENKEHVFTFKAVDTQGNQGTTDFSLMVQPAIRIVFNSPVDGTNVSGIVPVSASISAFTALANVELLVDGKLENLQATNEYTYDWASFNAPPTASGVHELLLRATDMNGLVGEQIVRVKVGAGAGSGSMQGGGGGAGLLPIILGAAIALLIVVVAIRNRKKAGSKYSGSTSAGSYDGSQVQSNTSILPGEAMLLEIQGANPGQHWALRAGEQISLGRKRDENDIPLLGNSASRKHAIIQSSGGNFILYNLKPDNPILVNGQLIGQQHILNVGDNIQVGDSVFEFKA